MSIWRAKIKHTFIQELFVLVMYAEGTVQHYLTQISSYMKQADHKQTSEYQSI